MRSHVPKRSGLSLHSLSALAILIAGTLIAA